MSLASQFAELRSKFSTLETKVKLDLISTLNELKKVSLDLTEKEKRIVALERGLEVALAEIDELRADVGNVLETPSDIFDLEVLGEETMPNGTKLIKFRLVRNDKPGTTDPEVVGLELTLNDPGWPSPQVLAAGLTDPSFGDFRGTPGGVVSLDTRHVDADGTKSEPFHKEFTLPTNVAPQAPGDILDVDVTGEDLGVTPTE